MNKIIHYFLLDLNMGVNMEKHKLKLCSFLSCNISMRDIGIYICFNLKKIDFTKYTDSQIRILKDMILKNANIEGISILLLKL